MKYTEVQALRKQAGWPSKATKTSVSPEADAWHDALSRHKQVIADKQKQMKAIQDKQSPAYAAYQRAVNNLAHSKPDQLTKIDNSFPSMFSGRIQ